MPKAQVNGIELEFETHGSNADEPLLLIPGLGVQLTHWSGKFIDALIERGFFVIVYDNRDVGRSSRMDDYGPADIPAAFSQARAGEEVSAPYTLEDLADDVVGLLDVLGIARAHILGHSNGGAVAQIVAIYHADRVASMVSMMATSGRRGLPRPTPAASEWLNAPRNPAGTRQGAMDEAVATHRIIGSPGYPQNEEALRERAARDFDRAFYPDGGSRHLLASIASGDSRAAKLNEITAPTLVIHGADDPLVPLAQGQDVCDSIPGAQMLVIKGLAHDIPDALVPTLADAILANTRR